MPLAYVRRSLTNNFLNGRRRHSSSDLLFADPPERGYDPDLAGRISDRELVRDLLDQLGPKQRAVLVLRFFHDLSDGEIAQRGRLPAGHRAQHCQPQPAGAAHRDRAAGASRPDPADEWTPAMTDDRELSALMRDGMAAEARRDLRERRPSPSS